MSRNSAKRLATGLLLILLVLAAIQYWRPLPAVRPVMQAVNAPTSPAITLPWPDSGQAALGASGYGLLASHNSSTPMSIASIAKVITAMAVLKQKPLSPGSQGPTITLDSTDVGFFNYYYSKGGSVATVSAGEQISEFQALETMLLPSANNMADSLARWAFGSVNAYLTYANQLVKAIGLINTSVGDSNGFSDTTTSTANDLVKLGLAALNYPALAQITSQSSAEVPTAGTIKNTNWLLGSDGVVGIKTGNTDKAGGCYLFAAQRDLSGHKISLVGAVLDAPTLSDAISAAPPLINASNSGFELVKAIYAGQPLGYYEPAWGKIVSFSAARDLNLLVWKGQALKIHNQPQALKVPRQAGAVVGTVSLQSGQQTLSGPLALNQDLAKPSIWWRLFRH